MREARFDEFCCDELTADSVLFPLLLLLSANIDGAKLRKS